MLRHILTKLGDDKNTGDGTASCDRCTTFNRLQLFRGNLIHFTEAVRYRTGTFSLENLFASLAGDKSDFAFVV